jgi:hypothetical protein
MSNVFSRALSNSRQFNTELFNIFAEAYSMYLGTISKYNRSWKDLAELEYLLIYLKNHLFDLKENQDELN